MPDTDDARKLANHWTGRARRLRMCVNLLRWLLTALPGAVAVHGVLAAAILAGRRADVPAAYIVSGYIPAMLVVAFVAWRVARKHFLTDADALQRLENHLRLHNRLSAALAGAAPWPEPVYATGRAYVFDPKSRALSVALLAGLPLVAAVTPLPRPAPPPPAVAVAEPPEWKEVEAWTEKLKKEDAADAEALRRMEERVAALRDENRDDMFRQGAQEATKSMKSEAMRDIAALAQNAASLGETLSKLEELAKQNRASAPAELSKEWKDALDKLANSPLPPGAALTADLKAFDPKNLKQLDPKKFKIVKAKLCKACENAGECTMSADEVAVMLAKCDGKSGSKPGSGIPGGVGGGGPADLNFTNDAKVVAAENTALPGLKEGDSVEAGDLLATRERKPDPDAPKTYVRASGGAGDFTGLGGDVVRRDRLTPEEAEFLSKYDAPAKK